MGMDGDAGVGPDSGGWSVAEPAVPEAPAPPGRSCPAGFTTTADGVCDPWPDGPLDCGPAEIHVPGSDGCEQLGPTCPGEGEWAADLPASGVRYVKSGAPAGGDGSRTAPFASIGDAARASGAGDVVALARGTYAEAVGNLRGGVTLRGACAGETIIVAPSPVAATLTVAGMDVAIRDVTLSGSGLGVSASGSVSVRLENVIVDGNENLGIEATFGAHVEAEGLIVRGTRAGIVGRGLDVEQEGTATIRRAVFEDNSGIGVFAADGGVVALDAVVVRQTRSGTGSEGLHAQGGASVTVARSVFEDRRESGVLAFDEGTEVTLEDVVVRRIVPTSAVSAESSGHGVAVHEGARVGAQGLYVDQAEDFGIVITRGASFEGEDVVVSEIVPRMDAFGRGASVENDGHLQLTRTVIRDVFEAGVRAEGSTLLATDLRVTRVQPRPSDGLGVGITVNGGRAELERVLVEDAADYGVQLELAGTEGSLHDVTIQGIGTDENAGYGLSLTNGVVVDGARIRIEDVGGAGLVAGGDGTRGSLTDLTIDGVDARLLTSAGEEFGGGIQVERGASVALERVAVHDTTHVAVNVLDAELHLLDLGIDTCRENRMGQFGWGLNADLASVVDLQRVEIDGAHGLGIGVFSGSDVSVRDVVVQNTESNSATGQLGRAVVAQLGGVVELAGASLRNNREVGMLAMGHGSIITASQVTVEGTRVAACAEAGRCDTGAGWGASAVDSGRIVLSDFRIADSALGGAQIASGGEADLERGVIANNPIGLNVQDAPDYDFDRLTRDVVFIDNERNIDSAMVPIPDAALRAPGSDG